ncbi:MAG: peptidase U32 family protein, partial [Methanosarcinaceae archaeon]
TVLSQELTLEQIEHIAKCGPVECVVEGRTTVMVSKYCMVGDILSQGEVCSRPCESSELEIVDAKGYAFPLRMDDRCRMHVLNSRRLCMLDRLDDLVATGVAGVRIEARADPAPDLEALTRAYRNALDGNDRPRCSALGTEPTTGHYYRGVL